MSAADTLMRNEPVVESLCRELDRSWRHRFEFLLKVADFDGWCLTAVERKAERYARVAIHQRELRLTSNSDLVALMFDVARDAVFLLDPWCESERLVAAVCGHMRRIATRILPKRPTRPR